MKNFVYTRAEDGKQALELFQHAGASRYLGGARAIGHLKQQAGHQVAPEQA